MTILRHSRLLLLSILVLIASCRNDSQELEFSAQLHNISSGKAVNFKEILVLPQGDFVVTCERWPGSNQQMWVAQFDAKLNLKWENYIGYEYNDYVEHTLITKSGDILVSGYALVERGDSISKEYKLATYGIHHALFDGEGNLTWERDHPVITSHSKDDQKIFSVFEDSEGRFVTNALVQNIGLDPNSINYGRNGLSPWVVRLDKTENDLEYKALYSYSPDSRLSSIHEAEGKYIFFGNQLKPRNSSVSIFEIYSHRFSRSDTFEQVSELYSSGLFDKADNIVYQTSLDYEDQSGFSEYKVFAEGIVRFDYLYSDASLTETELNTSLDDLSFAVLNEDKHFLFIRGNHEVIETDAEINVLNSFKSAYPLKAICKLPNNTYVGVYQNGKRLFLVQFDETGKVVDDA